MLQNREQGHFLPLRVDDLLQRHVINHFKRDRRSAEHRKPERAEQSRDKQNAEHEFTYRTPLGDPGYEHADKGRPCDPPCPVKQCPVMDPRGILERLEVQAHARQMLQVTAERGREEVHDKPGRS